MLCRAVPCAAALFLLKSRKIFKAGQSRPARRVLKLYKAQMGRRPNVPLSLSQSTDFRPLKDFRQGQAPNAPEGVRAHDALDVAFWRLQRSNDLTAQQRRLRFR